MAQPTKDMPSIPRRRTVSVPGRVLLLGASTGLAVLAGLGGCVSVPPRGDASVFVQGRSSVTSAAVLPGVAVAQAMREPVAPNGAAVLGGMGAMSAVEAWAISSRRDDSLGVPGVHQAAGVWPQLDGASLLAPRRVRFQIDAGTVTVFDQGRSSLRGRFQPRIY